MEKLRVLCVVLLLLNGVFAQDTSNSTATPEETTTSVATTPSASTEATTAKPTETTAKPTETTAKPTETTAKPTETTAKPTETTAKPTETTAKPTEATTPEPATTTEDPSTVSDWKVKDENKTCLRFQGDLTLEITYTNSSGVNITVDIHVPSKADSSASKCKGDEANRENLVLKFDDITVQFVFNKSDDNVFVKEVSIQYKLTENFFPAAADKDKTFEDQLVNQQLFKVGNKNSWACESPDTIELEKGNKISLKKLKYQAFVESEDFQAEVNCKLDDVSDVVPIVVGCALAALVLIVLVAYLVGRRRSRQKAEYQSM